MINIINVLILIFLFLAPAFAEGDMDKNKKEFERVGKEIKDKLEKQYELYEQEKSHLFLIQRYDQKLDELQTALKKYNKNLVQLETSIGVSRDDLTSADKQRRILR